MIQVCCAVSQNHIASLAIETGLLGSVTGGMNDLCFANIALQVQCFTPSLAFDCGLFLLLLSPLLFLLGCQIDAIIGPLFPVDKVAKDVVPRRFCSSSSSWSPSSSIASFLPSGFFQVRLTTSDCCSPVYVSNGVLQTYFTIGSTNACSVDAFCGAHCSRYRFLAGTNVSINIGRHDLVVIHLDFFFHANMAGPAGGGYGFGKLLASTEKADRDKAVRAIGAWLVKRSDVSDQDLAKLWKGIFYCMSLLCSGEGP